MPKSSRRKRLTRPKDSKAGQANCKKLRLSEPEEASNLAVESNLEVLIDISDSECSVGPFSPTVTNVSCQSHSPDLEDSIWSDSSGSTVTPEPATEQFKRPPDPMDIPLVSVPSDDGFTALLLQCRDKLNIFSRPNWISIVADNGIHILMLSRKMEKCVQRRIYFSTSGEIQFSVHCKPVDISKLLLAIRAQKPPSKENVNYFVDRIVDAIEYIRPLEICTGVSCEEFKPVWKEFDRGYIDRNPYQENRYSETVRSENCELLISPRNWRCKNCAKVFKPLQRLAQTAAKESVHPNTPNSFLSVQQKEEKLAQQQKVVKNQRRKLDRLTAKMQLLLEKEGVVIDNELSTDLDDLLSTADLSEEQSLFLQQQLKATKAKKACGRRWHPTMIRLALQIYMHSKKVYKSLQATVTPPIASKILSFMVKGVASNVKEVVASFAVDQLTKEQLYCWSWEVISKLETAGIAVVAYVMDGSSVNRAFIKMHSPVTDTESGIIFDTVNKAAPHRQLYFLSDVPHLLKTIRNCFQRSTEKKFEKKNGKKIWKRCTSETAEFIKRVNDWFDMLNGNDFNEGKRKNNLNLYPYERENDPRFAKLEQFVQYLKDWGEEAERAAMNSTMDTSAASATAHNPDDPATDTEVGAEEESEEASPASMRQLSHQTLEGIEIAARGFIGAVKFLLREGVKKINARVFCQDPIEQFFSKQRYKGGRNPTPNSQQFFNNQVLIHNQGEMGSRMSFGTGNTEVANERLHITCEKLPKRKSLFSLSAIQQQ
ncbi:hypothetical protein FOCC_FOCC013698 [Frankliniella occidentalis]|nr:hypothetical protein FOCC_FOCC013698 [Frankliniella occidentalis]